MKILYFTNNLFGKDGWSRHSLGVIEYFSFKYKVVVLVNQINPSLKIKQIPVLRQPEDYLGKPWLVFWDLLKIRRVVRNFFKDSTGKTIVHFLLEPYALFLPFLGRGFKKMVTLHGTYSLIPLKSRKTRFLARKYYKMMDRIIAVSNFTREFFLKECPHLVAKDKFEVINNGINFKEVGAVRKNGEIKNILFVGMVKNRKGPHHLLQAAAIMKKRFDNFQVDIVGHYNENSEYFKKLGRIIKENHLDDFVYFRGRVSDEELDKYYRQADVLVMPSVNEGYNFEGFGIVYLEANMYGVPAIGSRNSGAEDAILPGQTGFLVASHNHQEIAERISTVITFDAIKSEDCVEWARKNDWSAKNKKLEEIYKNF